VIKKGRILKNSRRSTPCGYDLQSRVSPPSMVAGMAGAMTMSCDGAGNNGAQRIEIFTGAGKRRDGLPEGNVSIGAESYSGQDSISAVARRYALCPSQLFTWLQELRKEIKARGLVLPATSAAAPLFVPAAVERAEPALIAAREVLERFHSLIRLKDAARLDPWIVTAARTKLAAFAAGVDAGKDAVAAAISTPWSSGKVEGTICRLKSIKRHMYGRGKLDLPRARIMAPA